MLTVYRASAGAGKTHKLTGEYLKLLFARPGAYRRILAVTFTNKATDEMKSRIIEELYHLSSGKPSDYVAPLASAYKLEEKQVRQQAREVLVAILHDYASFNISTIDRFFQQTMRAFTREIGLQGGYGIEMDQELVLTEAVDRMLAGLEKPENKELLGWLLRFAEEKIENGGEWNLRRDIMGLGRELFKERYKAAGEAVATDLADKQALDAYKERLYAIIRAVENEAKEWGKRAMELLDQYRLSPSDFKGGSRSPLYYFEKLARGEMKEPTATFLKLADNEEAYCTKTMKSGMRQLIGCVYHEGLNEYVKGVVALFANLTDYYTAKEIVRYYYTLGILTDLSRQIAAYREEKNVMLIADTTELLNRVIAGSDAPFIYEKTGTYVDHYMIDEFQDTSGMQWDNFKPLVEESLAHRYDNLVVGDVKQSIYRFRNSDWKLLDEQVQRDFPPALLREETLKENWRSCRYIVDFNNALFTIAPALLQGLYNEMLDGAPLTEPEKTRLATRLVGAYDHSFQQVPPPFRQKAGHVQVTFLETEGETDWREEALCRLPGLLERLQDNGYALKEIAILVRTNREGAQVADALLAYKEAHASGRYRYDIISDEALFVSGSPAVRFLVTLSRYLKDPGDRARRQLAFFSFAALTGFFDVTGEDRELPYEAFDALQEELLRLSRLPLYEMAEGLYRLFADRFAANEQVFLQAYLDMVSEYARKESPDLGRFLRWWDESGNKKTIATPDEQNAVRILTVHKSKGLGFKAVILPFCDWEIDHRPTKPVILWCRPEGRPFDRLPLVPVRYSQQLVQTRFAKDYFEERLHAFMDNLNTLYVAFTRAKEELLCLAPRPKRREGEAEQPDKITSVASLLWSSFATPVADTRQGDPLLSLPDAFDRETGCLELGDWWHPASRGDKGDGVEEIRMSPLRSIPYDDRLQLRLMGKGFCFDDRRRKHGTLMHEVLSGIRTGADIAAAVERYRLAGVIGGEEAQQLAARLDSLLALPAVRPWFDGSTRVLNEVEILFGKGLSKRPDRVMIAPSGTVTVVDYKFGEKKSRRYVKQVREYMELVRRMGYAEVAGYLWYVERGEVEAVEA